jgi:hypothetical protein
VSDLDIALADVRRILDRLDESRAADQSRTDTVKAHLDNASALLATVGTRRAAAMNGSAAAVRSEEDARRERMRRNLDDVRRIAATLQHGSF